MDPQHLQAIFEGGDAQLHWAGPGRGIKALRKELQALDETLEAQPKEVDLGHHLIVPKEAGGRGVGQRGDLREQQAAHGN